MNNKRIITVELTCGIEQKKPYSSQNIGEHKGMVDLKILQSTISKMSRRENATKFVESYKKLYERSIPNMILLNLQCYNTFITWDVNKTQEDEKNMTSFKEKLNTTYFNNLSANNVSHTANNDTKNNTAQAKPFLCDIQDLKIKHINQGFQQLVDVGNANQGEEMRVYENNLEDEQLLSFQNISDINDLSILSQMIEREGNVYSIGINMSHSIFQNIPNLFNHMNLLKTYRNSGNSLMYDKLLEIAKNDTSAIMTSPETEIDIQCKNLLQLIGERSLNNLYLVNQSGAQDKKHNWLNLSASNAD